MKKEDRFQFDKFKKKVEHELYQEYSSFAGFLAVLVRTLSPLSYKKLAHNNWMEGFRYFFHILLFSFVLFIILTIPHLVGFYDQLRAETDNLNNFSLAPQLDVNQVIEFEDFGIVVANDKNYDGELLLITSNSISWPDKKCLLIEPICMFYEDPEILDFSRAKEIVEDRDKFTKVAFGFILLMLPGIFIALFAYLFIKYLVMLLIFFVLGYIWSTAIRLEIHVRQIVLIAIYSLSLSIVVQTVFGFYYDTYYIPYILSFVLFLIATYLVADKPFHHFKSH